MASFLDRYLRGEHEAVWEELTALGEQVRTEPIYSDAWAVASETMRRARTNVEWLIPRLEEIGYRFGIWEDSRWIDNRWERGLYPVDDYAGPHTPPSPEAAAQVRDLENLVGTLPLSLRAWLEIVGDVDFRGFHPGWASEYPAPYPDPLVVWGSGNFLDYLREEFAEWQEDPDVCGDEAGRFLIQFAPDFYHKANVSGGSPYSIAVPDAAADAPVPDEPHNTTFINYLSLCFAWGGFPGFSDCPPEKRPEEHLRFLREGLLPL